MKLPVTNELDISSNSTSYTYALSKYSCLDWVYPIHMVFCYLMVVLGGLAIIARMFDFMRPYHLALGRGYILSVLWSTATAVLLHNHGLPYTAIIIFTYLYVCVSVGWSIIRLHISRMAELVTDRVQAKIEVLLMENPRVCTVDLRQMQKEERAAIVAQKTFVENFFSLKTLHGMLMVFSWSLMFALAVLTNPATAFAEKCFTYPAYKWKSQDGMNHLLDKSLSPAPLKVQLPFLLLLTFPSIGIILVYALVYYAIQSNKDKIMDVIEHIQPMTDTAIKNT